MCLTPIQATDSIEVDASPAAIWRIVADVPDYPDWWPKSLGVRLIARAETALGCEVEIRPPGGRPFRCRVVEVLELQRMRMRYLGGFVEGSGEWILEPIGDRTRVTYRLEVAARGRLVRLLGKLIDLSAIHSRSMKKVLLNLRTRAENQGG